MELHEKIRGLREDKDLTQKQIADLLKTSTQYYQKYEKGKHTIPVNHLKTLCLFYGVSADKYKTPLGQKIAKLFGF